MIYAYTIIQIILEILHVQKDTHIDVLYVCSEEIFGAYFCYLFLTKVKEFKEFRDSNVKAETSIKLQ
jgi:hypothetical protein